MKIKVLLYISVLLTLSFLNSCNKVSEETKMLQLVLTQEDNGLSKDSLHSLYLEFCEKYPLNAHSHKLLYKMADYYKMTKPEKSSELFKEYFDKYPDSAQAANSLFNAAYMFESSNPDLSKELYKKFINKYPKDERTESAIQNLKYVGKPVEFIMEELIQSGMIQEEIDSLENHIK